MSPRKTPKAKPLFPENSKGASAKSIRTWGHLQLACILLFISFCLTFIIAGSLYLFVALNVPAIKSLASYNPPQTSVIYDAQERVIAKHSQQNRVVVPLTHMPPLLPQAFVAAEDARFYEHSGVDAWSVMRALMHNVRSGSRGQGGSTITQQVARALLLTPEKTYTRKIKEAILAYRIDNALSKKEILHIYLNQIYLGSGAYGVEAAAQVYFDKHINELNLAEISLLAGLPQAPSRYSPFRHYKLAKKRQAYVLNRMAEEGYISPTKARKAFQKALFWGPTVSYPAENNYFLHYIRGYVSKKYGKGKLKSGGLHIYTTLNQTIQKQAVMAIKRGTAKWAIRQNNVATNKSLPQAALVAMEVKTGKVRALVGGTDFAKSQFNRATQARRQPGSAFKPIIYAAALAKGLTPASLIEDAPLQLQGATQEDFWEPQNFSGKFYGPTTLRDGLVYSRNIVTIKILQQTGVGQAIKLAKELGISAPLSNNLSLALGSSGISPLELTRAYTAFANLGRLNKPIFIRRITLADGTILEDNPPEASQVIDPKSAFQVTRLLEGVVDEGTGKSVRTINTAAAGKTGTTDNNMDAWFVGYTPELATGVWLGHDKKTPLGHAETGGRAAAPIWLDFMKRAYKYYPSGDFEIPKGITIIPLDNATGKPGYEKGERVSWEAFRDDNPPIWPSEKPAQEQPEEIAEQ